MSLNSMFGDILELIGRAFGRRREGDRYHGTYGSEKFFEDLNAGNKSALETLKSKNYGTSWRMFPSRRTNISREIERGLKRSVAQRMVPRGALTGYMHYGIGRSATMFHPSALKLAAGIGVATMAFSAATAPKGHMGAAMTKSFGENAGGVLGAAAGAFLFGMPGELIGGYLGGEVGGVAGKAVTAFTDLGREAVHSNFGGGYHDSDRALTMRQRAVQEMGQSALNARMYLGQEAKLFHQ